MGKNPKLKHVTWQEFDQAVEALAKKLEPIANGRTIYGQPRGGLCLAVALSHRLGIPLAMYGKNRTDLIWVDDIIDSGDTYTKQRMLLSSETIWCSWYARHDPRECLVAEVIETDDWLVFPWESAPNAEHDRQLYGESKNQIDIEEQIGR